ncbi:hypothetical protein PENTCL1PPCAC_4647, partial [Pristionchus entomophagus]
MSLGEVSTVILGTTVTWSDLENHLRISLVTEARLGPHKSVVDIGDGNGFKSCCGLITCDWEGADADEKLPKTVVIKIPSTLPLRKLNDAQPEGQRLFDYSEEQWTDMERQLRELTTTEVATYDFFQEFEDLAMPKKYYGIGIQAEDETSVQLCLEYIGNSRLMSLYEKHSVEQVKQIARALGKIQACSLKNEVTAPKLQINFFEYISIVFPLETYRGMIMGLLTVDSSEKTKAMMEKVDALIPVYHGATLPSTIYTQMGFRPVLVNGDLHAGNVLIDKNTGDLAALLDWEGTHLGVGVEDLHRITLSALTAEERRASTPMLVEEMYNSMVQNLDGADPPYSLETLLLLSDLIYPHCALFFSVFISFIAQAEHLMESGDCAPVQSISHFLIQLIGSFEDFLAIDIKNKTNIGNLKQK